MSEIRLNVHMTLDPQHFDEVARLCEKNVSDARDHDGVLEYSFFASEMHDSLCIHERYADADAMLSHLQKLDPEGMKRLIELVDLKDIELAAESSPRAQAALDAFGVPVFHYLPLCSL